MIKIEHTEVYGFQAAIRGIRNLDDSWEQSDSGLMHLYKHVNGTRELISTRFDIGENDLELMRGLVEDGSEYCEFLRMINTQCDITAPLCWWSAFDTAINSYSAIYKYQGSCNQRRTVQLDYELLRNVYRIRKTYKSEEWKAFREWAEGLPYFEEICLDVERMICEMED